MGTPLNTSTVIKKMQKTQQELSLSCVVEYGTFKHFRIIVFMSVECNTPSSELGFKKSRFLFWQRKSQNMGKICAWKALLPLGLRFFPCDIFFPVSFPCLGKFPVLRVITDILERGEVAQCRQPQCRICTICFNLCFLYISFLSCVFRSVLISLENHLSFLCLCFPISSLYSQLRVQTTQRYLTPSIEYLAQWEVKGCNNIIMEIVFEDKLFCMGNYLVCI